MALDPLDQARTLVKRAHKDIKNLDVLVHNYLFAKPYEIVIERDHAADKKIARLRYRFEIPDEADEAVHNAIQNLRSALEYIAWSVANRTSAPLKPKTVSFPFYKDASAFGSPAEQRKIEQIGGRDWLDFLSAQKPYRGGNDVLFSLDEANNIKKHRHLMRIGSVGGPRGRFSGSLDSSLSFNVAMFTGTLEDGMDLVTVTNSAADPEVAITINIALREVAGFERQPVVATLRSFKSAVEDVLAEARRSFWP